MHRPPVRSLVVLAAVLVLPSGSGLAQATVATTLVSMNASGSGPGNGDSFVAAVSSNGRFVAFMSDASDLVADDTNGTHDVFVRDVRRGITTLVSRNHAGTASGNGSSLSFSPPPVMSANGRYVAFASSASDLVTDDTNGFRDVFVRDLKTNTTTLVSRNSSGTASGNGESNAPSISANGRFVAFQSYASDLVPGDTNGAPDIFVRDLKAGVTTLVSVNSSGTASGSSSSDFGTISADGRVVAFTSNAGDLVPNDTNNTQDVFVRDLRVGTTVLVSASSGGTASGGSISLSGAIDAMGRSVAFFSGASDIVPDGAGGGVFRRDLRTGVTTRANVTTDGTPIAGVDFPVMSANARSIGFRKVLYSFGEAVGTDVYVRDLKRGVTVRVSESMPGPGVPSDGPISMSANGGLFGFDSIAGDVVGGDTNGGFDAFVYDVERNLVTLASVNAAGTGSGNGGSYGPLLSANGRVAAFSSAANDLVAGDTNGKLDVFVRSLR